MSACHPTARRVNAELDAGRAQDKASNAAVALKGLEQQLEALRAEAAELREGAWVGGWVGGCLLLAQLAGRPHGVGPPGLVRAGCMGRHGSTAAWVRMGWVALKLSQMI